MDMEWGEIIRLLPVFGSHARLAFEYVELFGVLPLRMKGKKILRLLQDVALLLRTGSFRYQRREYHISEPGIWEALRIVCNKHFEQPLENHNYLKKVMIGISERERKEARDAAEREQKQREERLRGRPMTADGRQMTVDGRAMSAEEFKRRAGVESLAGLIGKGIE